jgi:prepilin peptidase CpaA
MSFSETAIYKIRKFVMSSIEIIPVVVLIIILTVAVITDILFYRIPNWLTFPSMLFGICYHAYTNGYHGFILSMAGLLLGICVFIPFYIAAGMGAGDVKLMGVVGVFLGSSGVCVAFLATAIVGGIYAIILLWLNGVLKETIIRYRLMLTTLLVTWKLTYIPPGGETKRPFMAYGVAIAIGTSIAVAIINCNLIFWDFKI